MFRCERCNTVSNPGEKRHTVVVETRDHVFPWREKAHRFHRDGGVKYTDDPGGKGRQIVRELHVCRWCVE